MAASDNSKVNMENFIAFAQEKHAEFFCLDRVELEKFLRDGSLVVKNEKEAFEALQQWVMHSPVERLAEVSKLLPLIRLNQLELEYLATIVNDFAIGTNCEPLVDSAIKRQSMRLDQRDSFAVKFLTKPRKSATEAIICAFHNKDIAKYSTKSKKWTTEEVKDSSARGSWPVNCSLPASCMYGKYEMIIYNDDNFMLLNLITLKTKRLPPLPDETELDEFTAHIVNDNLFVIGRSDPNEDSERYMLSWSDSIVQDEMLKYNFVSGVWSHLNIDFGDLSLISFVGHCSAVLNGKIYLATGRSMSYYAALIGPTCAELECYDPIEDEWTSLEPMHHFRYNAEMVAFKHYLYVFGGLDQHDNVMTTIERYDSIEDEWSIIGKLKDYVYGFGLITVLDRVYFLGGECTKRPHWTTNKVPDNCDNSKSYAVFDLNTETVSSHHQKIRKMPQNMVWPSVGYYINE